MDVNALVAKPTPRYAKLRLLEAFGELALAARLLEAGPVRTAANKAFLAVKALVSSLLVYNMEKLDLDKKTSARLRAREYTAPTTGLRKYSQWLLAAGIDVEDLVNLGLLLHMFAYNGLDPGGELSPYGDVEAAARDLKTLAKRLLDKALMLRDKLPWDEDVERGTPARLRRGLELFKSAVVAEVDVVVGQALFS